MPATTDRVPSRAEVRLATRAGLLIDARRHGGADLLWWFTAAGVRYGWLGSWNTVNGSYWTPGERGRSFDVEKVVAVFAAAAGRLKATGRKWV